MTNNEYEAIAYCSHCSARVDLCECETDSFWTNDGDRVVYHVCPECGESVEDTNGLT